MHKAIAARASALALLFLVVLPVDFTPVPAWGAYAAGDLEARVAKLEAIGELPGVVSGTTAAGGALADTEVRRWGFGIEQVVDAAALLIHAQAHFYAPTIIGFPCGPAPFPAKGCGGDPKNTTKLPAEPWQGFVTGARILF